MATDMFLYWGSGSPPCWRIMLVLEEKGLQGYQQKLISFEKKEHKGEEVLKLNPRGQVPTFRHGSLVINESMAVCEYLESTFSGQGTKLISDDQATKARVLQRMHEHGFVGPHNIFHAYQSDTKGLLDRMRAQNIQKRVNEEVMYYLWRTKPEDQDQELLKTKKQNASEELNLWDGYLGELGDGSYIVGKEFSMADAVFFPAIAILVRLGLDLTKYPHIGAYYTMMSERPSVKATWPPHWKDSEGSKLLSDI